MKARKNKALEGETAAEKDHRIQSEHIRRRLVETLQWIAADYDERAKAFTRRVWRKKRELQLLGDELALCHEDSYIMVPQLVRGGYIGPEQERKLHELDELFERMSDMAPEAMWTPDAVRTRPEWDRARIIARELLVLFGEPRRMTRLWQ